LEGIASSRGALYNLHDRSMVM